MYLALGFIFAACSICNRKGGRGAILGLFLRAQNNSSCALLIRFRLSGVMSSCFVDFLFSLLTLLRVLAAIGCSSSPLGGEGIGDGGGGACLSSAHLGGDGTFGLSGPSSTISKLILPLPNPVTRLYRRGWLSSDGGVTLGFTC